MIVNINKNFVSQPVVMASPGLQKDQNFKVWVLGKHLKTQNRLFDPVTNL
jgi:hypothetical protein